MEPGENRKKKSVSDFNFRSSMFFWREEINKKKDEIEKALIMIRLLSVLFLFRAKLAA